MTGRELPALSERQHQVLRLRAEGLSGPQIAAELVCAVSTVDYHERVIVHVLRARNVTHAVHLGWQAGLFRRERHGDHAGFRAHERRGEDPWACGSCAAGERVYRAGRRDARRTAAREPPESPVAAPEAPGPHPSTAGASGGGGEGFNGPRKPSSSPDDSRSTPSEAENALHGGSPGLTASDGPGPASSP